MVGAHSLRRRKRFLGHMRDSTPRRLFPHRKVRAGLGGGNHLLLAAVLRCIVLGRMAGGRIPDSRLVGSDSQNDSENRAEKLIRRENDDVAATHEEGVAVRCSILVQVVVGSAGRSL